MDREWQPVESAPKDETSVLLWGSLDADWGMFPESPDAFSGSPEMCIGYWAGKGWHVPNHGGPGDYEQWCKATHWMPLPEPPNV